MAHPWDNALHVEPTEGMPEDWNDLQKGQVMDNWKRGRGVDVNKCQQIP